MRVFYSVFGISLVAFLIYFMVVGGTAPPDPYAHAYVPGGAYYSGYGSGPEWDKYQKAEEKGPDGWPDMKGLMASSDAGVAWRACETLVQTSDDGAIDFFFEGLPTVGTTTKESVRHGWYDGYVFDRAAQRIKEKDPKTKEGAMLFIKLSYARDSHSHSQSQSVFDTLVSAIPDYTGAEADELAYAISLFRNIDEQPLIDMLSHTKARARQTAVIALGKGEFADALDDVKRLKSDSSAPVRVAARRAQTNIDAAIARSRVATTIHAPAADPAEQVAAERKSTRARLGMP